MVKSDVTIIGAGPAGLMAALKLIQEGINVTILEKSVFPRFVIGESLLPSCMNILEKLDLIDLIDSKKFQIKTGATFLINSQRIKFDFSHQISKGWSWTWQVERKDFDKIIADEAERRGVNIMYNTSVNQVKFDKKRAIVSYTTDNIKNKIESKFIIDASGFARVLPRMLNVNNSSSSIEKTAIFSHIKSSSSNKFKVTDNILVEGLDKDIWMWFIPLSNKLKSIGFVGNYNFLDKKKSNEDNFLNFMNKSDFLEDKNFNLVMSPKVISNYAVSSSQYHGKRYVLSGNTAEFLDPVFSSGVALAIESGFLAAKLLAIYIKGNQVDWDKQYSQKLSSGISIYKEFIELWYTGRFNKIISLPKNNKIKSMICSILAGYVWDTNNPLVKEPRRIKTIFNL